jgi:hypothetical protein
MHTRILTTGRRRTALVSTTLAAALLLTAMLPGTAEARTSFQYRDSGRAAETSWTQVDDVAPGTAPFGNVHVGYLDVRETRKGSGDAWGEIADFDCEPGQLPGHGGHHGGFDDAWEEPADACTHVGFRWIEGSDLAFDVDKKLTNATLRGRLTVYGGAHGEEGPIGTPMADITWTGDGATWSSRFSETYTDGFWTYTYRGTSTTRSASMGGQLGPMGFDPELSDGSIREYRVSERGRSR